MEFRSIGKHLHKNEYLPINLANHPTEFTFNGRKVVVNWGWAARSVSGVPYIEFDDSGTPMPYDGFWEARCYGSVI